MKKLVLILTGAALLAVSVASAGAAPAKTGKHHHRNIVQTAVANGQFTTLVSLVKQAGLAETLSGKGPFTVFAPTDAAFAKLPKATLDELAGDPALLKKVLLYHVVSGRVSSAQAAGLASAPTVEGENVQFSVTAGGGLKVDDANVIAADIKARNGVVHAIDSVLLPPSLAPAPKNIVDTAVAAGSFTTLVKLLQATGLDAVLAGPGPFTVFAPTDAAFARLPKATLDALAADPALLKQVLLHHVVSGKILASAAAAAGSATTLAGDTLTFSSGWCHPARGLRVDNTKIVMADVLASNGVIHVINKVLIPSTH